MLVPISAIVLRVLYVLAKYRERNPKLQLYLSTVALQYFSRYANNTVQYSVRSFSRKNGHFSKKNTGNFGNWSSFKKGPGISTRND